MEKEKLKTEITILELLNWLVYDIPPTKNAVIHSELNDFIENHEQNYNANRTNLTFEKFCELKATYDDIINKILEGYLPLYAYKIYDPWALYLSHYKEENPKELVYSGRQKEYTYNWLSKTINFLLDFVSVQTKEEIKKDYYDVWRESYIKYKEQNEWRELPSFEEMKAEAINNNGCYTYDKIVVRLRDVQNTYYNLSTFCNKYYKRTKEAEQNPPLKLKKEKRKDSQVEKNGIRKVTNMKAKIIKSAIEFMKMAEYKDYTRQQLANEIHIRLVSEGYKEIKESTIQSYLPANITKHKRGRREKNPVKYVKLEG